MNIFVTDTDPVICASHHCDRHEAKMILESAQMLCAVWHRYGEKFPNIYKETHPNHHVHCGLVKIPPITIGCVT